MKPRGIIVLEGADGTGKTTLARALCERYDGVYIHNRYHKGVGIWRYHLASLRWAARVAQERLVVVDRHWPSECVYGRVYRDGPAYKASSRALHRALLRFGAVYVVCAPRVQVVIDNHKRLKGERREMYGDVSQVAQRYVALWNGTGAWVKDGDYVEQLSYNGVRELDWFHYDYTVSGRYLVQYVQLIASVAQERRDLAWQPGLSPYLTDVTGQVASARVCLVGDRPAVDGKFAWPFTACANSSRYLNEQLHKLAAVEERFCLINVNGRTGPDVLRQLPRELPLVALGQEALRGLNQLGRPPVLTIRHPQHARRFTHHGEEYGTELRSALAPHHAAP